MNTRQGRGGKDGYTRSPSISSIDDNLIKEVCEKILTSDTFAETLANKMYGLLKERMVDMFAQVSSDCASLQERVTELEHDNWSLNQQIDDLKQHKRRKNIRVYGMAKTAQLTKSVHELVSNTMNLDIPVSAIKSTYEISNAGQSSGKPGIMVTFSSSEIKDAVMTNVKTLKGKNIVIREDLTPQRASIVKKAVKMFGPRNVWTRHGHIYIKKNNKTSKIKSLLDFQRLVANNE